MDVAAHTQWLQEQARPLLDLIRAWLLNTRVNVANGSGTAKAMDYSINRWAALSRHAVDGRLPIDNNAVETTIRPIAIGKKNWLFTGSERAGQRAAAIQTLLGTAKLNGLDPAGWLRDALARLQTCLTSQLDSPLPLRDHTLDSATMQVSVVAKLAYREAVRISCQTGWPRQVRTTTI